MPNSLIKLALAISAGLVIGGIVYHAIMYLWDWYQGEVLIVLALAGAATFVVIGWRRNMAQENPFHPGKELRRVTKRFYESFKPVIQGILSIVAVFALILIVGAALALFQH